MSESTTASTGSEDPVEEATPTVEKRSGRKAALAASVNAAPS